MIDSGLGDQVIDKNFQDAGNKHSAAEKETAGGWAYWFAIAPNRETMPDPRATSQFCALYSFTGILFMGWVGALLVYQPFYVSGLEDIGAAKSSAFGALGLFIVTFASSIVYLCYDSCCKFRYGALSTHDTDAGVGGGVGYPRGMSEYEVNIEMADAVAQRMGEPRIRLSGGSGTAGGMRQRRPYSDTPYSDEPPARGSSSGYRDVPPEAAPASGNSAHSAPITPSGPRVMVAGMPRSNSTASAVSSSTPTGNLLGLGDDGDDDGSGSGSSEEEGDWAATSGAGSAPSSGNGPVDLLS